MSSCSHTAGIGIVVDQRQAEYRCLLGGHIADRIAVEGHLGVLNRYRSVTEHKLTRVVPLGAHLTFVGAVADTTLLEEDETTVFIIHIGVRKDLGMHQIHHAFVKDAIDTRPINANRCIAEVIGRNGKAHLARDGLVLSAKGSVKGSLSHAFEFCLPLHTNCLTGHLQVIKLVSGMIRKLRRICQVRQRSGIWRNRCSTGCDCTTATGEERSDATQVESKREVTAPCPVGRIGLAIFAAGTATHREGTDLLAGLERHYLIPFVGG